MVLPLIEGIIDALSDGFDRDPEGRALVDNRTLTQLGEALAARIDRARPFSHRHLKSILNGTLAPPAEDSDLGLALRALSAEIDDVPTKLAGSVPVTVFVPAHLADQIRNALITKTPKKCARPACFVLFIPNAPNQIYHAAICRILHYKERKKK